MWRALFLLLPKHSAATGLFLPPQTISVSTARTHATKGDVNGDGKITDDDSKLLNNWLTRSTGKNDLDLKNADVNLDGKIQLFTELECCDSCSDVIAQFLERHTNIEIEIIHNNNIRITK